MKINKSIKVGDKVKLLKNELLDDNYHDHLKTKILQGTIMNVVAVTPKVRMSKGPHNDSHPYFLNLELPNNHNRVRTNFCNVVKIP